MPFIKTTDDYWSKLYDNGRDFSFITSKDVSKILSFTDNDSPKTCLDIGCGTGQLTRELYHRGYACVGVDAATSAIKIAESLTAVAHDHLHYVHFDIEHDDIDKLPQKSYSLITCKLVYAFIKDKPAFLDKVKSLLVSNGIFVVVTPHVDDVSAERRGIAVGDNELGLLSSNFEQLALHKGDKRSETLTYFIGRYV